ncbi:alpha/beta hydrolase [Luteimonas aestuarii]|uniref:alpha/beta hydrolase n=1 Tax=Luteimonas aestuarii TaxID=453837 RepID=UPI001A9CDB42|nr:alpha/beta hydrolase-fold protein [Luteimonas aestuarii]
MNRRVRHWLLAVALALICTIGMAQAQPGGASDAVAKDTPLQHLPALRGDYFLHASAAVGRSFHIYVRLPEGYDPDAPQRYPVVYLLDGDSLFPILAANHLFLTYDDGLPEAIVVGIAYGGFESSVNRRGYDFSAPAADAREDQGGADRFLALLREELLPEVERRYAADPMRRILFGQSRGGYFVLYSAFVAPDLFWGRIASNPAFDPGRGRFFAAPPAAVRDDLGLVVTSGARDWPALRESALAWFDAWRDRQDAPWAVHLHTVPDGTHAADSVNSYRAGMGWLFGKRDGGAR